MSTSFLIWTFLLSILGIFGIFAEKIGELRRTYQQKITAALQKKVVLPAEKSKSPMESEKKTEAPPDVYISEEIIYSSTLIEEEQIPEEDVEEDLQKDESAVMNVSSISDPADPFPILPGDQTVTSLSAAELKALLGRAEVFLARNEFVEAEKLFIKILAFNPNHPAALQKLAFLSLQTEAYGKAENLYRQLLELTPKNPAIYTNLALALFNQKKFTEAIAAYEQAIELEPARGGRYANLGQVYFVIEDLEMAIRCFQEAVKKEPRNVSFLYLLGDAFLEGKHFVEAKRTYERILDISPYDDAAKEEVRRLMALGF